MSDLIDRAAQDGRGEDLAALLGWSAAGVADATPPPEGDEGPAPQASFHSPDPPAPGDLGSAGGRVGRYTLLEKIGEGGFALVFMAEQKSPVVRHVALKVIK